MRGEYEQTAKDPPTIAIAAVLLGTALLVWSARSAFPAQAQAVYQTLHPMLKDAFITRLKREIPARVSSCSPMFPSIIIIQLNGLDENCNLITGTKILLGVVEAPALTETAQPTATLPPELITPRPPPSQAMQKSA